MENVTVEETAAPRGRNRNGGSRPASVSAVSLGPHDSLSGNLAVEGDVHVEGTLEGQVHTSGDIEIETAATARARLEGRNITVRGAVTGDIVAKGRLNVAGSGSVIGDVRANRLRVEDGATINGSISMAAGEDAPAKPEHGAEEHPAE
jgi:cytoskeletal protein CcmA (bactofilin family)